MRRRSCKTDSNNNISNDIIDASQSNESQISVGEIVWIKHQHYLDTPVIVQDMLNGVKFEVRNLIDDTVVVLSGRHLTKSCNTLMECREKSNLSTFTLFREYKFRNAIASTANALNTADLRLKFCSKKLPKILKTTRMDILSISTMTWLESVENNFKEKISKLQYAYKFINDSMKITKEESMSIASKILQDKNAITFAKVQEKKVCNYCLKSGLIFPCEGTCNGFFHKKCISRKTASPKTNWQKLENNEVEEEIEPKRRTLGTIIKCKECREQEYSEIDMNNNNNKMFNCETCKKPFSADENVMACVKCNAVFHSTVACVPAGALLLSKSQLVCTRDIHNDTIPKKKTSICSYCGKKSRRKGDTIKCTKCANAFHKACNRNGIDECEPCSISRTQNDIVYTYVSNMWWPAIVVSNEQVPNGVRCKRKYFGPGAVFVFTIGTNDYKQVHASNLLSFYTSTAIKNEISKKNNDDFSRAIEIATELEYKVA